MRAAAPLQVEGAAAIRSAFLPKRIAEDAAITTRAAAAFPTTTIPPSGPVGKSYRFLRCSYQSTRDTSTRRMPPGPWGDRTIIQSAPDAKPFGTGGAEPPPYHRHCWLLLSPELPNAACAQTVRQSRSLLMGRLST